MPRRGEVVVLTESRSEGQQFVRRWIELVANHRRPTTAADQYAVHHQVFRQEHQTVLRPRSRYAARRWQFEKLSPHVYIGNVTIGGSATSLNSAYRFSAFRSESKSLALTSQSSNPNKVATRV